MLQGPYTNPILSSLSLDQSHQSDSHDDKITPAVIYLLCQIDTYQTLAVPKGCVYFASSGKSTAGTILPSTNRIWLKAK